MQKRATRVFALLVIFLVLAALTSIAVFAAASSRDSSPVTNPYSPAYNHSYRHGAEPTITQMAKIRAYEHTHPATSANTLSYGGGIDGIGVTSGTEKVYLVFWGTQWGTRSTDSHGNLTFSNDTAGAAPYLQNLFKGLGTGGELWSGTMTQYCDGSSVSSGATSCASTTAHVGYPTGGAFAGVWYDNSGAESDPASGHQLAQEAVNAAAHFGNTTAANNRYAQYVILSATGTNPDNYQTGGFCAWHDYNGDSTLDGGGAAPSPYGDIAFTNMPYVVDAGTSCGENYVNSGSAGTLDGFSIVEGHEYAETVTDQNPAGGWTNASNGQENGDECAWIAPGQAGGAANVTMGSGSFAEQSIWSNDDNQCDISHPIVDHGGGNTAPTANNGSVSTTAGTAVSGTLSATDSDGDSLTFAIVSNPSNGSVSITNAATGAFTYTPASGFTGTDSFTFNATDSAGNASNTATETATVSSSGGGGTFSSTDTPVTINDNATIQDVIPVSGQGANGPASLKVNVNIAHNWSGDLEIDLIAPDGTLFVLQSPDYNNDGNINTTYTVNASSVPGNGNWTLQVIDNDPSYSGDLGTLNSWSLQF